MLPNRVMSVAHATDIQKVNHPPLSPKYGFMMRVRIQAQVFSSYHVQSIYRAKNVAALKLVARLNINSRRAQAQ